MKVVFHQWHPWDLHIATIIQEINSALTAHGFSDVICTEDENGCEGEFQGILRVWQLARQLPPDDYIGYLHTKGALHPPGSPHYHQVTDWRRYMLHFFLLGPDPNHDLIGVNWQTHPWAHFAGNFWWARCAYLRTLPQPLITPNRWAWEAWVGQNTPRVLCRFQSRTHHYNDRFPPTRYTTTT